MPACHQFLPTASDGDAVFNFALLLRRLLREQGFASEIYAMEGQGRAAAEVRPYQEYAQHAAPGHLLLYHFAIGSVLTEFLCGVPGRKILVYHNMTPPRYCKGADENTFRAILWGQQQLRRLREVVELALGVSEFNRSDLEREFGFPRTGVLPLTADFEQLGRTSPDPRLLARLEDGAANILFVGKIAPHKCQDDLIKIFYLYHTHIEPCSRLVLVGSSRGADAYDGYLRELSAELGLKEAVLFLQGVSKEELVACYRAAHLFLCMSEHEGVCVPLLESMYFRVPILSYAAAAVPETLGEAGVLLTRKEYHIAAETAHVLLADEELRKHVIEGEARRIEAFALPPLGERLKALLDGLGYEGRYA